MSTKMKDLTCGKCSGIIEVGYFSKNEQSCPCGGVAKYNKPVIEKQIKIATEPKSIKLQNKVKVLPHEYMVDGVKCQETGFSGILLKELGPNPNGELIVKIRKDKNGIYDILRKYVVGI